MHRIAFTDASGEPRDLMITARSMVAQPARRTGWTAYALDSGLPSGGTIEAIDVNDRVFTHAGDNGAH